MTDKKVWLITGAGRGMGADIAKAALEPATPSSPPPATSAPSRRPWPGRRPPGRQLDVTAPPTPRRPPGSRRRFGRIDVLVNNAGNFYAGFFEEIARGLPGAGRDHPVRPVNVTRAVLPVMRAQRSGLVVAISSTAGIVARSSARVCRPKFGVEGWIESLTPEVAPFGIRTMLVEPGFFRTELLTPESTKYAEPSIDDYAERTKQTITAWNGMNGRQGGDPAKLADALVQLAGQQEPPLRFVAGADAMATVENKAKDLLAQAGAYRELSGNLAYDDA